MAKESKQRSAVLQGTLDMMTVPDRKREFKYYRLTDQGKKQLVVEESQWKQMAEAVGRVMWPVAGES